MRRNWTVLALPVLALVLAGAVLVSQNLSAAGSVPATTDTRPVASTTEAGAVTVANWQETANVRGKPGGNQTAPAVHTRKAPTSP